MVNISRQLFLAALVSIPAIAVPIIRESRLPELVVRGPIPSPPSWSDKTGPSHEQDQSSFSRSTPHASIVPAESTMPPESQSQDGRPTKKSRSGADAPINMSVSPSTLQRLAQKCAANMEQKNAGMGEKNTGPRTPKSQVANMANRSESRTAEPITTTASHSTKYLLHQKCATSLERKSAEMATGNSRANTLEALASHCRERLATKQNGAYKKPEPLWIPDTLPRPESTKAFIAKEVANLLHQDYLKETAQSKATAAPSQGEGLERPAP